MNENEIIPLLEEAAVLITHKTNIGAFAAIEHVLYVAQQICQGMMDVESEHIPTKWLKELKNSGINMQYIYAFRERRKQARLYIQELVISLLEKQYLSSAEIRYEFLSLNNNLTPLYFLPDQVADYKANNILLIDTEIVLSINEVEALQAVITQTSLRPREAFAFTGKLRHQQLVELGLSLLKHKNVIFAEAQQMARLNTSMNLEGVFQNINAKITAGELTLIPDYVRLVTTPAFKQELVNAMQPAELYKKPTVNIPSGLANYVIKTFDNWVSGCDYKGCSGEVLPWNQRNVMLYKPNENKRRQAYQNLAYFITAKNLQHPIHLFYNLTDIIIESYKLQNKTLLISQVCSEITGVIFQNRPQNLTLNFTISTALSLLPKDYLRLICEAKRMACADQLQTTATIKTSLLLVSRLSIAEVEDLTQVFSGSMNYETFSPKPGESLEEFSNHTLTTVMYPINSFKLNSNLAMELVRTVPDYMFYDESMVAMLNAHQLAASSLKICNPVQAHAGFFSGKLVVERIQNEILLNYIAVGLASCLELHRLGGSKQFYLDEPKDTQTTLYDTSWMYAFTSLALSVVLLLGINTCTPFKPLSSIKSVLNKLLFGKNSPRPVPVIEPVEHTTSLLQDTENKGKSSVSQNRL